MPSIESNDARVLQLTAWSRGVLGRSELEISVASADASFRRYFRARAGSQSWIVMDAPPEKEDTAPYLKVAQMLAIAGVNAPKVFAQNPREGFLLLSDLGDRTYLTELADEGRADSLYDDAIAALVAMQVGCAAGVDQLPSYDAALLNREMELFPEWFVGRHLQIEIGSADRALLDEAFALLGDSALRQPRVFVHRDYHSRNLMVTERDVHGPNPGILDFQDAVCGPITYDLVSLLRDCYIAWPLQRVHGWLRDYRARAGDAGLETGASEAEFVRGFDLMGVQRHLKAIGIFARLAHRDGKRGYLNDIPRTLNYVRTVLSSYPELKGLAQFIDSRIAPELERQ